MRVSRSSSVASGVTVPYVMVRVLVLPARVPAKSAATSVRLVRAQAVARPVKVRVATK
jgi:hypothetical protein